MTTSEDESTILRMFEGNSVRASYGYRGDNYIPAVILMKDGNETWTPRIFFTSLIDGTAFFSVSTFTVPVALWAWDSDGTPKVRFKEATL